MTSKEMKWPALYCRTQAERRAFVDYASSVGYTDTNSSPKSAPSDGYLGITSPMRLIYHTEHPTATSHYSLTVMNSLDHLKDYLARYERLAAAERLTLTTPF